jgi:hypothetical protein
MPAVNRRARLVVLLLLATAGCGGGEGDTCDASGEHRAVFGPGTGTCTGLDLDELAAIVGTVALPVAPGCRVTLEKGADDGGCVTALELDLQVGDDLVTAGTADVTRTCAEDDEPCTHGFSVSFEPVADP